jgi:hypothetical protein
MVFLFLTIATAGAEVLVNGGFEEDLTDWDSRGDRDMSAAVADAARTGLAGLRVTDATENQGSSLISLPVEVVPGRSYEVSCWGRGVSGTGGVGVYLRFINDSGKAVGKERVVSVPAEIKEWKPYAVRGIAPENAVAGVVWIHSFAKDMPVVDLDDFEFRELPSE